MSSFAVGGSVAGVGCRCRPLNQAGSCERGASPRLCAWFSEGFRAVPRGDGIPRSPVLTWQRAHFQRIRISVATACLLAVVSAGCSGSEKLSCGDAVMVDWNNGRLGTRTHPSAIATRSGPCPRTRASTRPLLRTSSARSARASLRELHDPRAEGTRAAPGRQPRASPPVSSADDSASPKPRRRPHPRLENRANEPRCRGRSRSW
jgi:hypothetical protein